MHPPASSSAVHPVEPAVCSKRPSALVVAQEHDVGVRTKSGRRCNSRKVISFFGQPCDGSHPSATNAPAGMPWHTRHSGIGGGSRSRDDAGMVARRHWSFLTKSSMRIAITDEDFEAFLPSAHLVHSLNVDFLSWACCCPQRLVHQVHQ